MGGKQQLILKYAVLGRHMNIEASTSSLAFGGFVILILTANSVAAATKVWVNDQNHLVYEGDITSQANEEAAHLYDQTSKPPERLLITSNGGQVMDGLELAEWIHENQMDVEIGEQCLSSCANYVFPAGRKKWIRRDSVLIWHGSAWQESFDNMANPKHQNFAPLMKETRIRETQFFESISVDHLLPVHGQRAGRLGGRLRRTWGFDYSIDDLERLGVTDIKLLDDEWDWRKYKPRNASRVIRVSLPDDYQFRLNRFTIE
jgi:hypothetical protein